MSALIGSGRSLWCPVHVILSRSIGLQPSDWTAQTTQWTVSVAPETHRPSQKHRSKRMLGLQMNQSYEGRQLLKRYDWIYSNQETKIWNLPLIKNNFGQSFYSVLWFKIGVMSLLFKTCRIKMFYDHSTGETKALLLVVENVHARQRHLLNVWN